MVFTYDGKKYDVNVKETLETAKLPEDFYPDAGDSGVAISALRELPEFEDCEDVCIFYNPATEEAKIHLVREDYEIIDAEYTDKELKLISDFFVD